MCIMNIRANVPAIPWLSQNNQVAAVNLIVNAIHQHIGGGASLAFQPNVTRASFAVEATYVVTNENGSRIWAGSWRKENDAGQLQPFEDLAHSNQLVSALQRFSVPGAIETRLADMFGHLDTSYFYDGLVSIVLVLQLVGQFSAQVRRYRTTFL